MEKILTMAKNTLNAQELLNACVSMYSLSKIDGWNCYNFPSCLEFYGSTVMIDARNNFLIAKEFEYASSAVACVGWDVYTTLEEAYKHLDYLLAKLTRFERNHKNQLESKRLKKIKDDF